MEKRLVLQWVANSLLQTLLIHYYNMKVLLCLRPLHPPMTGPSTHMNNHSDSMGKLSLYKKDAPDDIQSPFQFKVPENLSPKACLPPSHLHPLLHLIN